MNKLPVFSSLRTLRVSVMVCSLLFLLLSNVVYSGNQPPTTLSPNFQTKAAPAKGKGIFKFAYMPVKNKAHLRFQENLKKIKLLENLAADLNDSIILPTDMTIYLVECGEANAFYNPEKHEIQLCYEYLAEIEAAFKPDTKSAAELNEAVMGDLLHTFYHELGHALIDILDLPVTGKEEDAVDQLSTFILADGTDEGEAAIISSARMFLIQHEQDDTDIEDLPFWDEHSLNAQRFYNLICWLYGHDEKRYASFVKDGVLPEDRAEQCGHEFEQLSKSWSRLLAPHLK
ncbi:MAG: DUF4344 domain-containing metallopeptidase [Acidobacteriota bacterium]